VSTRPCAPDAVTDIGFSRLTFAEATAFGDDQRDFQVRVPDFHPNGYAALTFRYDCSMA
jgi:hypothetical protein